MTVYFGQYSKYWPLGHLKQARSGKGPPRTEQDFYRKIGQCHFWALMVPRLHAKNQKKIMTQFWEIIEKVYLRAVLGPFCLNKIFPGKSDSVTFEHLWSPNFMQKIRKNKWLNSEKLLKKSIFGPFWALFCPILPEQDLWSLMQKNENRALSLLKMVP